MFHPPKLGCVMQPCFGNVASFPPLAPPGILATFESLVQNGHRPAPRWCVLCQPVSWMQALGGRMPVPKLLERRTSWENIERNRVLFELIIIYWNSHLVKYNKYNKYKLSSNYWITMEQASLHMRPLRPYEALGEYGPISIQLGSIFQLPKNNINSFI